MLRHLLENAAGMKFGCVINDVASVNVDAKLVRNDKNRAGQAATATTTTTSDLADTVELSNGCACAASASSCHCHHHMSQIASIDTITCTMKLAARMSLLANDGGRGLRDGRLQHPGRAIRIDWAARDGGPGPE